MSAKTNERVNTVLETYDQGPRLDIGCPKLELLYKTTCMPIYKTTETNKLTI